jgi:mitotic spindle assembly checkpoint protein MAD2
MQISEVEVEIIHKTKQVVNKYITNYKSTTSPTTTQPMAPSQPPTRSSLSLRGSAKTIAEFFEYSINSILYQRGIYPPDDFTIVKKYGLNLLVACDDGIKAYIRTILQQLNRWVVGDKVSRLVLAILARDTGDVVERWQFDIHVFDEASAHRVVNIPGDDGDEQQQQQQQQRQGKENKRELTQEEIQRDIQAIIRQITASVTFLPALETGDYTFNVLVYADADARVPSEWIDSDAKEISNAEKVKFRSFSTNSHKVDTLVSYRYDNNSNNNNYNS